MRGENKYKSYRKFQDKIRVPDLYYMKNHKERFKDELDLYNRYQDAMSYKPYKEQKLRDYEKLNLDSMKRADEALEETDLKSWPKKKPKREVLEEQ